MNTIVPSPECERMVQVAPFSQMIGDFLDWLNEQGIQLCEIDPFASTSDHRAWWPRHEPYNTLLARYFQIDLNLVEEERRNILAQLQTVQLEKDLRKANA